MKQSKLETSQKQSREINGLLHAVSDTERMGDHCNSMLKLLSRRYDRKLEFSDQAAKEITEIGDKVAQFLSLLKDNMLEPEKDVLATAYSLEQDIDEMRDRMKKGHLDRLQTGACDVLTGFLFTDLITSFEKMGDHSYNIAEMLAGER